MLDFSNKNTYDLTQKIVTGILISAVGSIITLLLIIPALLIIISVIIFLVIVRKKFNLFKTYNMMYKGFKQTKSCNCS